MTIDTTELRRLHGAATQGEWTNDKDWPEIVCDHEGGSLGEMTQGFPGKSSDADNGRLVVALHNAAPALFDAADRLARVEAVLGSEEAVEVVARAVGVDKTGRGLRPGEWRGWEDAATAALAALRELIGEV